MAPLTTSDQLGAARAAQRFYTRHAGLYDRIARAPGVGRVRERTIDTLDLSRGDTVVELGCGTGANLPRLRERVGREGRVLGVDFAPGPLVVARDRAGPWSNVAVCRGDAATPPVEAGAIDAVLATFLTGMLPDPASAVETWSGLLADGGRIALLDAAPSRGVGAPLNPLFRALVRLGSPPGTDERHGEGAARVLDRRVGAAHGLLRRRAAAPRVRRSALGFLWLTAGRPVEP